MFDSPRSKASFCVSVLSALRGPRKAAVQHKRQGIRLWAQPSTVQPLKWAHKYPNSIVLRRHIFSQSVMDLGFSCPLWFAVERPFLTAFPCSYLSPLLGLFLAPPGCTVGTQSVSRICFSTTQAEVPLPYDSAWEDVVPLHLVIDARSVTEQKGEKHLLSSSSSLVLVWLFSVKHTPSSLGSSPSDRWTNWALGPRVSLGGWVSRGKASR